jgi:hypothetical protein
MIRKLSALVALVGVQTVFGWGPEGHRIVASIALEHLTDQAKSKVAEILGEQDFVDVANWADQVRLSRSNTKDWHFVDIPVSAATYDADRDCQQLQTGDCAIAELTRAKTELRSSNSKTREEALKFIIHFVGDIHQPLHSATNDSRADGDRGGNSVSVRLLTHSMNLHQAWDHGLIDTDDRDENDYAEGLDKDLVKTGKATDTGTMEDWVNEAHQVAVKVGYHYPGFTVGNIPSQKVLLSQGYVTPAKTAVDLQLARGGIRLARVLNEALGQ